MQKHHLEAAVSLRSNRFCEAYFGLKENGVIAKAREWGGSRALAPAFSLAHTKHVSAQVYYDS